MSVSSPSVPSVRTVPASPAQEQLWLRDQRQPGSAANNLPVALSLDGPLDAGVLAAALNDVVARHDIFRTRLDFIDGQAVQVVAPALAVTVPVTDLRLLPADARDIQAFRLAREEAARPFDPRRLPLLRAHLFECAETKHILVLTLHRAIFDHGSLAILLRELVACYEARRHATAARLPALPLQYADYASRPEAQAADLAWWRGKLAGHPAPLHLPSDRAPAAGTPGQGRIEKLELSAAQRAAAQVLAARLHVEPATVLLAAFQVVLHRHTGRSDFLVGLGLSGRQAPEAAGLLGQLSQVVPLRATVTGDLTFRALVERLQTEIAEAVAHAAAPVERLAGEDDALVCAVEFSHQEALSASVGWPGVQLSELDLDSGACACELALRVIDHDGGLTLRAEYDADRFTAGAIQRLLGHFGVVLQAAVARPATRLAELPLLTASERRRLLAEWNSTFADFPRDAALHELIAAHATSQPDAVAVSAGSRQLTWRELDRRSNQLARHLRTVGVRPGMLVGLCADHSPQLAIALLGIWKSGGAVLPIDPSLPGSQLARLIGQSKPGLIFTESALRQLLPVHFGRVLVFEAEANDIRRADDAALSPVSGPDDSACAIATSGTGGQLKVVELSHRALVGAVHALRRTARIVPEDVVLATAPLSSLDLVLELLLPLAFGARLVLAQPADVAEPGRLGALTYATGATVMLGAPSFWQGILDAGWTGNPTLRVLLTGEPVSASLAARLGQSCQEAWNLYGTVETAGVALASPVSAEHAAGSLGRPVANAQVHLLDSHLQPVPVGIAGEIFVGGDTLATGYRREPLLTGDFFVADPFRRIPGARLFRTGDLARRVPNGEIEFLGRLDQRAAGHHAHRTLAVATARTDTTVRHTALRKQPAETTPAPAPATA